MVDTSFAALQRLIGDEFGVAPDMINRDTAAEDVDGWDSISHATIIMTIERQYGIRFPNEDIYTLANVGELYDRIVSLRG
jgi:acyl carrier protein